MQRLNSALCFGFQPRLILQDFRIYLCFRRKTLDVPDGRITFFLLNFQSGHLLQLGRHEVIELIVRELILERDD